MIAKAGSTPTLIIFCGITAPNSYEIINNGGFMPGSGSFSIITGTLNGTTYYAAQIQMSGSELISFGKMVVMPLDSSGNPIVDNGRTVQDEINVVAYDPNDATALGLSNLNLSTLIPAIVTGLLDGSNSVETGQTVRQSFRLMLSALAGKLSITGGTTVKIRDVNDTKDRITATVDATGQRTAVTLVST